MQYLADNYVYGIAVLCSVVCIIYLIFSIRLIVTSRREGINICASAMIPFVNIIFWVRKCVVKHKNNKVFKDGEIIKI